MNKLTLLIGLIFLTLNIHSEVIEKTMVEAGKPSIAKASQSTNNQLVLSVGVFDPVIEKLDFSQSKIPTQDSSKYLIVQFHTGKADSQWLKKQGIKVMSYMPNNAFIVASDSKTNAVLDKNTDIRWHGNYISGYKISSELWQDNLTKQTTYDLMISIFSDYPKDRISLLFKKYLPQAKIIQILSGSSNLVSININHQDIDQSIQKLALLDVVKNVELIKPLKHNNAEAVSAVQANESTGTIDNSYVPDITPIWDKSLFGTGQIIGVADSGLDSNEDWFVHYDNGNTVTHEVTEAEDTIPPQVGTIYPNNKIIGYFVMPGAQAYDHAEAAYHGTHVTGSIAGDRQSAIGSGPAGSISSPFSSGYDNDDGMAPNAQILFQDHGNVDQQGESFITAVDRFAMWEQAYIGGVRIHSNSYGGETDGQYTFSDYNADRTLHEFEDLLILIAAGNTGPETNTIGSAGNAKNVITVGMLLHGNSTTPNSKSSRGPTDDGRLKPDIMATGTTIASAAGDSNTNSSIESPLRKNLFGTSMATPITAGSSALLRQYFTDGFYPTGARNPADEHNPSGPLMKATLINGAGIDGGHFNNNIGWGRVNLSDSLIFNDDQNNRQLRAWEITNNNGLQTNQSKQFQIGVSSDQPLIITLTWYDIPGSVGSGKALVNDLDLTLEINGTIYKGNNFLSAESQINGEFDRLNTVEQIRINTPVEGIYTITVNGASIPGDGTFNSDKQGFGLVASAQLLNLNSSTGNLATNNSVVVNSLGLDGNNITWSGNNNADFYEVYRVDGTCNSANHKQFRYIGNTDTQAYIDSSTDGGYTYAYKIRSAKVGELGGLSNCVDIVSEQTCDIIPTFNQNSIQVVNSTGAGCHVELEWETAVSNCPTAIDIKYNIYRSDTHDFIPSTENLIATSEVGSNGFDDIYATSGTVSYYTVLAEDNTSNGSGPNQGNQTLDIHKVFATAFADTTTEGNLIEDVDNIALMKAEFPWQVTSQRSFDGLLSYHSAEDNSTYPNDTCGRMTSAQFHVPNNPHSTPQLVYQTRYNIEADWDGVVVEISTNNGTSWNDLPPDGGYPADFNMTQDPPINGCGYASTHGAFNGSTGEQFQEITHDLSAFAGQDVFIRWSLSTDPGAEEEGFYLDAIEYQNIDVPNACTAQVAPTKPQPGLYFDRSRSGHGFVIEPIANTDLYFTVFYTYKADGTPEWYTSLALLEDNILNVNMDSDTLRRFTYDYDIDPTGGVAPNTVDTSVGTNILKIDFNKDTAMAAAACNDGVERTDELALATWQLGTQQDTWCIDPLVPLSSYPTPDFGGTWYTGRDDSGWGLSISFFGDTIIVTIYYYDPDGTARWVQGLNSGFEVGEEITVEMKEFAGFARDATPIVPTSVLSGMLTLTLNANNGDDNDGELSLNLDYQGDSSSTTWNRDNVPVLILTEAH